MIKNDAFELLLDFLVCLILEVILEILFVVSIQNKVVELVFSHDLGGVMEWFGWDIHLNWRGSGWRNVSMIDVPIENGIFLEIKPWVWKGLIKEDILFGRELFGIGVASQPMG